MYWWILSAYLFLRFRHKFNIIILCVFTFGELLSRIQRPRSCKVRFRGRLTKNRMAGKAILTTVKVNLKAGEATPAPPLGPILGQHGVAIMDFVKQYNDASADKKGQIVPAVITIYEDRSFTFELKLAPVSELIKKALKIQKGSGATPRETAGTLTSVQVTEIAQEKMQDLNTTDLEAAKKIVMGTARSMGVKING